MLFCASPRLLFNQRLFWSWIVNIWILPPNLRLHQRVNCSEPACVFMFDVCRQFWTEWVRKMFWHWHTDPKCDTDTLTLFILHVLVQNCNHWALLWSQFETDWSLAVISLGYLHELSGNEAEMQQTWPDPVHIVHQFTLPWRGRRLKTVQAVWIQKTSAAFNAALQQV